MKTISKRSVKKITCPKCGLGESRWIRPGQGFIINREHYCCEGCPENTGCLCVVEDPRFVTEDF